MSHTATRYKNLDAVFTAHITKPIDRKFVLLVLTHVNMFVRKDENSVNFFGGNLIGVYPIKWTNDDKMVWINDVLEINDYDKMESDIYDLPDINKNFKVSSDAINLSMLWIAHKALISTTLSPKEKHELAKAAIDMLQYKFISSIHTHYFKYTPNIGVALAVYESLDNKSQLKRAGNWKGLFDMRTEDILSLDGLHTHTLRNFDNDIAIVKMVNDIQSRIKSIFNILTAEFYRINDLNARIASSDKFTHVDGEALLKDSFNQYAHIKSIMHDLLPDVNAFVREDLITVITIVVDTAYPKYLRATLTYISQNYSVKHKDVIFIPELIDEILMFAFSIIRREHIELHNVSHIAMKLKGMLRSSRVSSPEYLRIKEKMNLIVSNANEKISDIDATSTRIAAILYIVIRSLINK